jgi:hypothetical protein
MLALFRVCCIIAVISKDMSNISTNDDHYLKTEITISYLMPEVVITGLAVYISLTSSDRR